MRIIISPAKKMKEDQDFPMELHLPVLHEKAELLLSCLQSKNIDELKEIWNASDKIVSQSKEYLENIKFDINGTPALLSYVGLAFQHMNPQAFTYDDLTYAEEHLRILSGFYGVLKPLDSIYPYRLEMQAPLSFQGSDNLYVYWNHSLYDEVLDETGVILNLASKEYSDCITPYLKSSDTFITCSFLEEKNGKFVQKGTLAKMARGEMVRYIVTNKIENIEKIKDFHYLNYQYNKELSSKNEYIFVKKGSHEEIIDRTM